MGKGRLFGREVAVGGELSEHRGFRTQKLTGMGTVCMSECNDLVQILEYGAEHAVYKARYRSRTNSKETD